MSGYYITGTDTGVGKTVVTAALIRHFARQGKQVAGLKPVASGCVRTDDGLRNEDALLLQACANVDLPYEVINPYAFEPAIAPHTAAARNNVTLKSINLVEKVGNVRGSADILIIEGAGGWLVPLNESETMADFARALGMPVILVVGLRLGCINHALLSARSIRDSGLQLAGWIANQIDKAFVSDSSSCQSSIDAIQAGIGMPPLYEIPYQDTKLNTVAEIDEMAIRFAFDQV